MSTILAFLAFAAPAVASHAYGQNVQLGTKGDWVANRAPAENSSGRPTVLSPNNSVQANGELAYYTAYHSFLAGVKSGRNRVQPVKNGGRWTKKITTGDGIVIFKDVAGNAAVQTPDGRWHVTDAHGDYASSSFELEREMPSKSMVAKREAAPAPKPAEAGGRTPASVTETPASVAPAAAPAADTAAAQPSAPAPAAVAAEASPASPAPAPVAAEAAPAPTAAATASPAPAAEAPASAAPATAAPVSAAPASAAPSAPATPAPAPPAAEPSKQASK